MKKLEIWPNFSEDPTALRRSLEVFRAELENVINDHALTASSGWTASNVTTVRSFDANTVTLAGLADVVGTLIIDLRTKGIISV